MSRLPIFLSPANLPTRERRKEKADFVSTRSFSFSQLVGSSVRPFHLFQVVVDSRADFSRVWDPADTSTYDSNNEDRVASRTETSPGSTSSRTDLSNTYLHTYLHSLVHATIIPHAYLPFSSFASPERKPPLVESFISGARALFSSPLLSSLCLFLCSLKDLRSISTIPLSF